MFTLPSRHSDSLKDRRITEIQPRVSMWDQPVLSGVR
jgi:hypothetical protein